MTQSRILRFLILGLPAGLIAGGVIAMALYFRETAASSLQEGHGFMRKDISRKDIESHVQVLARTIGPRHAGSPDRLKAAVKYIESTLGPANLGYLVNRDTFTAGGTDFHNIVLQILSTSPEHGHEIVLVGAHYDTALLSPGADSNASGVAACMSLAQTFARTAHARTLRFVFFANGAPPWRETENTGSLVYAKRCRERGETIAAMISLDSLGCYTLTPGSQRQPGPDRNDLPATGDFLAAAGPASSRELVDTFTRWFRAGTTLPCTGITGDVPGFHAGDHQSFAAQGYPAVMITDTGALRNPHHDLPGDTAEKLDYERLTMAVKGLEGLITRIANPDPAAQ